MLWTGLINSGWRAGPVSQFWSPGTGIEKPDCVHHSAHTTGSAKKRAELQAWGSQDPNHICRGPAPGFPADGWGSQFRERLLHILGCVKDGALLEELGVLALGHKFTIQAADVAICDSYRLAMLHHLHGTLPVSCQGRDETSDN